MTAFIIISLSLASVLMLVSIFTKKWDTMNIATLVGIALTVAAYAIHFECPSALPAAMFLFLIGMTVWFFASLLLPEEIFKKPNEWWQHKVLVIGYFAVTYMVFFS